MSELKPCHDCQFEKAIGTLNKAIKQSGTYGFIEEFEAAARLAISALRERLASRAQPDNEQKRCVNYCDDGGCGADRCHFQTDIGNCEIAGLMQPGKPDNAPLTLAELRGMDGEPVWIVDIKSPGESTWMQYAYEEQIHDLIALWEFGSEMESAFCTATYGKTWLAYRRKPEPKGGAT